MSQEDVAGIPDSGGEQPQEKMAPMCPSCGSKLTRRSMRRSWKDRLKGAFGVPPFRCQLCSMRFTVHERAEAIARHNAEVGEDLRRREERARRSDAAAAEEEEEPEKKP